jgi:hypothetical protein
MQRRRRYQIFFFYALCVSVVYVLYVAQATESSAWIGTRFALMEAALVLATLAQHADLDPLPGCSLTPQAAITLRPKDGVWMVVNRRQ